MGGKLVAERESRPAGNEAAPNTAPDEDSIPAGRRVCWVPCTWTFPQDTASQLSRRRESSKRLVRLTDCCGARDPLSCRCHNPKPQLGDNAVDAWRAAIKRTLPIGPPLVPIEVLQRLWRNGGTDRQLAEQVWAQTGGAVA